ncbi:hypothetical protein BDR04DRAFT_1028043 [Suillus decipiens]|nr:hypothetical protein BDR04DRAFT_1028043 [Suillus decipiens]
MIDITGHSPAVGIKGKTPYEMLFNWNADPSFFCPFGCPMSYILSAPQKHSGAHVIVKRLGISQASLMMS